MNCSSMVPCSLLTESGKRFRNQGMLIKYNAKIIQGQLIIWHGPFLQWPNASKSTRKNEGII